MALCYPDHHPRSITLIDHPEWEAPSGKRTEESTVGSVVKKRRKRMAKKKHRKLLRKTRVQRRNKK